MRASIGAHRGVARRAITAETSVSAASADEHHHSVRHTHHGPMRVTRAETEDWIRVALVSSHSATRSYQ